MTDKKVSFFYKILRFFVNAIYNGMEFEGAEKLPENEPVIVAANHTQMNSPIISELYYPRKNCTWCAEQMMVLKEVPQYAFKDFWSQKPKAVQPFFKIASYLIAPLSVVVFNNADTVPVYHDRRVVKTFSISAERLEDGADVVIFPEKDERRNNIVYEFQEGFVDTAKVYYKKTGKRVKFVPLYVAPALKKAYFGEPIEYNPENNPKDERKRICDYLINEITDIAVGLPKHRVVPYRNMPKKDYPFNK